MKDTEMSIPHLFRCPISLDLFTDPVTLCTGQTYDRPSIEKWLAAGNRTCPVTMQRLHDPSIIVPNHALRHLIDQWLLQFSHEKDLGRIDPDRPLAALKRILESDESSLADKVQALDQVWLLLSGDSQPASSSLLCLLFLPPLLEVTFGRAEFRVPLSLDHVHFVDQALLCALKLLSLGEVRSLNLLKQEPKTSSFVSFFEHGTVTTKISLCQLLEIISTSSDTKELFSILSQKDELLDQMILHLHQNSKASDAAIKAISSILSIKSTQDILIRKGLVNGLVKYISSTEGHDRKTATPLAMVTLEKILTDNEKAIEALVSNPQGMSALVKMVFRVSHHEGSESAVNSLIGLCSESLEAREEALSAGVLTQLLLLLQSQCCVRIKTKARMLLKLLRSKCNKSPLCA